MLLAYGMIMLVVYSVTASAEKIRHKEPVSPAYQNVSPKNRSVPSQDSSNEKRGEPLSVVADYARKNGMSTCVKRIDQVHKFLIGQSQAGIFTFMPPTGNPDAQVFSTSLEVHQANAMVAYASSSYSPGNSGCTGLYETVSYRASSCKKVLTDNYPDLKIGNPLRKDIQVLDGGKTMRIFLMPADKGCVVIKKEIVY